MTVDQVKEVALTYRRFLAIEDERSWSGLDDIMIALDPLTDSEIAKEADIANYCHQRGSARCESTHKDGKTCLVPEIVRAVGYLLDYYVRYQKVDRKMRYILQMYIAMDQFKMIVYDLVP